MIKSKVSGEVPADCLLEPLTKGPITVSRLPTHLQIPPDAGAHQLPDQAPQPDSPWASPPGGEAYAGPSAAAQPGTEQQSGQLHAASFRQFQVASDPRSSTKAWLQITLL